MRIPVFSQAPSFLHQRRKAFKKGGGDAFHSCVPQTSSIHKFVNELNSCSACVSHIYRVGTLVHIMVIHVSWTIRTDARFTSVLWQKKKNGR